MTPKPEISNPVCRLLVVDDESNARLALSEILTEEGYHVRTAADGFHGLSKVADFAPHIVLTDLKMPGMSGIELLEKIQASFPEVGVIVMTAFGAVETAVSAMRAGAVDYLTKPLNAEELLIILEKERSRQAQRDEAIRLRAELNRRESFEDILGSSPKMQDLFKIISQVAQSRANVLISGESGTGKERVAAAIHRRSPRKDAPFVRLHCAALAETLLESELFGHEKGAFTGADRRRPGRFEQADGGTLFLDEIGEISPAIQVKLLRVLQEREFERVGGNETIRVDVRLVAASNRDLKAMVNAGQFREDLYYRLNVVNMLVPSLHERISDIPTLADHFRERFCRENHKNIVGFTDSALRMLSAYHWPGNVRELENIIERAVVLCQDSNLDSEHLPPELRASTTYSDTPIIPGANLADIERFAITRTLEWVGGSTSRAAKILGISVRKVQYKLREYHDAPEDSVSAIDEASISASARH